MSKKSDKIQQELIAAIRALQNPASNPAQNYLTTSAIEAADKLKAGDYSNLGKGMFFDFDNPVTQMKQYDQTMNVGNEGTYALGDSGGAGKAQAFAGDYRKNLFARTTAENYQNNVREATNRIQGALGQAAGAKGATDANVIGALQGLYGSMPKSSGGWMGLVGGLVGSAASLTKAGGASLL